MKFRSILASAIAIPCLSGPALAQDAAWTAVLTIPPFPSPFIAEWERNPASGTLVVLHSGASGAEYRVEATIDGQGGRVARVLSGLHSFTGPGTQLFTMSDARDWRRVESADGFLEAGRRSGLIPEGAYRACARLISVQGVLLTESCVDFRIALPDPPRLILPAEGAPVATMQPVFQWTSVAAPAELGAAYTIRIVEREASQSPEVALLSNPIHHEVQVFGAPLLVYPADALPLEAGHEYVWSVDVVDGAGRPLTAVGRPAEVRRFTYQGVTATDLPTELTLVPGVAVLRDLAGVAVHATDIAYVLNGSATLDLAQPFTARVPVELRDFAVDRATLAFGQPRYVGGTAAARVDGSLAGGAGGTLRVSDIEFIAGRGLYAVAHAQLALAATSFDLEGVLHLDGGSYTGELVGEAGDDDARIAQPPVEYRIQRAVLRLPEGTLELTGALAVDDSELCPELVARPDDSGGLRIDGSCTPAATLAFGPSGAFAFAVDTAQVEGLLAFGAGVAAFDVRLAGALTVQRAGRRDRLAEGALRLGPAGASMEIRESSERLNAGAFDIGLARLTLSNGRTQRLAYSAGAGWDVAVQFDGRVEFPTLDTVAVTLRGIVLSDEGLYVPAAETPLTGNALELDGFRVRPVAFRTAETRVSWDAPAAAGWGFGFDAHIHFPDAAPVALRSTWLEAVGLQVASEGLIGTIRTRTPEQEIIIPVAGDVRLAIRELGGALEVRDGAQRVRVDVRAAVLMPPAVHCAADPEGRRPLRDDALLSVAADGVVGGVVPIDTPCPVRLGPLALHASDAALTFARSASGTSVSLAFDATAALPGTAGDTVYGAGSIALDLARLRLTRGRIAISQPFRWDLPTAGPFLSFTVQSGHIDTTGVVLTGSGTAAFFDLDTATGGGVEVQFRSLTLALPELRPVAGTAVIRQEFALDALWEDERLQWRGRRTDEPRGDGPGLRLVLPPDVALGADGLSIEGNGTATLVLEDTAFVSLDARFGSGFMLRIDPDAGVAGGRADLTLNGRDIAYVDSTGIWPGDLLGLVVLPDVLPLPTAEIAFVQLRDDQGNPLVEATMGVTGARLRSIPDRAVSLVVPALGSANEFPPAVAATFDVVVDPESFEVRAGAVTAAAAEGAGPVAVLRGAGLPISIRSLTYEHVDAGFALRADADAPLALQDGTNAMMRGRLTIDGSSVRGVLEVAAQDSVPLVMHGVAPVLLTLRRATLTLPERTFALTGGVRVLGRDIDCAADDVVAVEDELRLRFGCLGRVAVPVGADTSVVRLTVEAVAGDVMLDSGTGGIRDYRLDAAAHLSVGPSGSCDASLDLALSPDSLALAQVRPSCGGADTIRLGWLDLVVSSLELEQLAYTTAAGLAFALRLDLQPVVPALPDLRLPALHGVRVTQSGLETQAADAPGPADALDLAGVALRIERVRVPALQLSWDDWRGGTDGGFRFDFDGSVAFTGGIATPACLTGPLAFTDGALTANRFSATLVERTWEPACALPLAGDARFEITRLAGQLAVALDSMAVESTPRVSGALVLPSAFACSGAAARIVAPEPLSLGTDGVLTGTLELDAPCTRMYPALALTFPAASLEFGRDGEGQGVWFAGAADAQFGMGAEPVHGTGELSLDIGSGRIIGGSLALDGPFPFNLPREQSAFSFELQSALLDSTGLRIDGAGALLLAGDADVDVTFDAFTLDVSTLDIVAGRVLFATPFALEAGVSDADSLNWRAVPAGAPLELETGVRLDLPPGVSLGENGLAARGTGAARLRLGGRDMPLSLSASDDFALDIQPLAVTSGIAQLAWEGDIVASIDALGFHPNLSFFADALIPARLGLPAEAVAYLELRDDDGALLVDVTEDEDGVRLRTRTGERIPLVVPAFAEDGGAAPTLEVTLDVQLDASGRDIIAGSLNVAVPDDRAGAFDLSRRGVPFAVDSISYEAIAGDARELLLSGRLALFGERQGARNDVQLALRADGGVHGAVDVRPQQARPLLPGGTDALVLRIDSVSGTFEGARFGMDLGGAILLRSDDGDVQNAEAVLRVTESGIDVLQIEAGGDSLRGPGFSAGPARLQLSRMRVPRLAYEYATDSWDFELLFDAALELTTLDSLRIGPLVDITVTPAGFALPGFDVPALGADTVAARGFAVVPLAFRSEPFTVDWSGTPSADGAFAFDLEVGFPASAPGALAGMRLTVLNAGFDGSRFTGEIESREPPEPIVVPLPGEMTLHISRLGGALRDDAGSQGVSITAAGSLMLPPAMRCDGGSLLAFPPAAELTLDSDGTFAGTVGAIAPQCPLVLGPLQLTTESASLTFAGDSTTQSVVLAMDARLRLPAPATGDSVIATGDVTVDLVDVRLIDGSIEIAQPFLWNLPASDPLLRFRVEQGRVDMAGLTITGTGALRIDGPDIDTATIGNSLAGEVGVAFDNLTLSLDDFGVTGGSARFLSTFTLDAVLEDAGNLRWRTSTPERPREPGPGVRVVLPAQVELGADGLLLGGTATGELQFGETTYDGLAVAFSNGFALGWEPRVGVRTGRADLMLNDARLAHIDSAGFWPGDIFAVAPLPAQLPLPVLETAYLQLRDAQGTALVETETSADGLRLRTRPGEFVQLVLPALASADAAPPALNIALDVVVNPANQRIVSGTIEARSAEAAAPLFALPSLPLSVTRLTYGPGADGYGFTLDAQMLVPGATDGARIVFEDLAIDENGLAGTAEFGTYVESAALADAPVLDTPLAGEMELGVVGARAAFGPDSSVVRLAGVIHSGLFRTMDGTGTALFFSGGWSDGAFALTVDPQSMPGGLLPIGAATFEPVAVNNEPPVRLTAAGNDVTLRLNGILRVPQLGDGFAVTVFGLEVGTRGVTFPQLALAPGEPSQEANLFGARLALSDSIAGGQIVHSALGIAYGDGLLTVELAGELTLLERSARFHGLQIRSNGEVRLAGASLLSAPLHVVPNVVVLDSLNIADSRLRARVSVTLPAPLGTGSAQQTWLAIAPDGSIEGGGTLTILDETPGLGGDRTQTTLGIATLHPRHVRLALDFNNPGASAVEAVGDLYLANDADNRIQLGDVQGGTVAPGLRIGFDGAVSWGNFAIAREFDFDFDVVRLRVTSISAPIGNGAFEVGFSGDLSLNLSAVEGSVAFSDFRIDDGGNIRFNPNGVDGGEFSIAGIVNLALGGFAYSDEPTTLELKAGGLPSANSPATGGVERIDVASYIRFGGAIDVVDVFAGGVDEFLVYRTAEGTTGMAIRRATLSIENLIAMEADFRYREHEDGFEMLLGASGELMEQYAVNLVGAIEKEGSTNRMGIFLTAGVTIPITPAVIITELGGGFFYNPRPEHLALVRQYANVSGSAGDLIHADVGRFAGLLYGGVLITPAGVAKGRVLLTVAPQNMRVDGVVEILHQGDRFTGDLHLVVGMGKAYAEGVIAMQADYTPVLNGNGELAFYVYGPSDWGVLGEMEVDVIGVFDGTGEMFAGPPGFVMQAEFGEELNAGVIKLRGGVETTVWHNREDEETGGYVRLGAKVSVMNGAATAEGNLRGAVIQSGSSAKILASGRLEACVLSGCKDFNVWARIDNGGTTGGFGKKYESELDAARDAYEEMIAAQEDAQDALDAALIASQSIALSGADLAAAYMALQSWTPAQFNSVWSSSVAAEGGNTLPGEAAYRLWYQGLLQQNGAPVVDTAALGIVNAEVVARLADLESRRTQVMQLLDALQLEALSLEEEAEQPVPESPVLSASFAQPVTRIEFDANGDTVKVMESGPGFEIDAARAAEAVSVLEETVAAAEAAAQRMRDHIAAIETGVADLRALLTDSAAGSPLDYARFLSDTRGAAELPFARQADMVLRRQDWFRARLAELGSPSTLTNTNLMTVATTTATSGGGTQTRTAGELTVAHMVEALAVETRYETIRRVIRNRTAALLDDPDALFELTRKRMSALDRWTGAAPPPLSYAFATLFTAAQPSLVQNVSLSSEDLAVSVQALVDLMDEEQSLEDTFIATASSMTPEQKAAYVAQEANASGMLLWYHLARAGVQQTNVQSDSVFADLRAAAAARVGEVESRHVEVSSALARLFRAHAGVTAALYDLYDGYLTDSADSAAVDPVAAQFRARRDALAAELEVPRVEGLQVVSSSHGYYASQTMQWRGVHVSGAYEYLMRDLPGGAPIGTDLLTVGSGGQAVTHRFAQSRDQLTVPRTVIAGARGGAGYTGMARADYTITYTPPGVAVQPAPGTYGTVTDGTPPTTPVVQFEDAVITEDGAVTQAWLSGQAEFLAGWMAQDPESGIAAYRYAVGTAPADSSLRAWTDAGGRTSLRFDDIAVLSDRSLYVSVQARNGQGMWSAPGVSPPLRRDVTPPIFETGAALAPGESPNGAGADAPALTWSACPIALPLVISGTGIDPVSRSVVPGVTHLVPGAQTGVLPPRPPAVPARITLLRPGADDAESGLRDYIWRADSLPPLRTDEGNWSVVSAANQWLVLEGSALDYERLLHVGVAARNRAGLTTPTITYGPVRAVDPTAPGAAQFCLGTKAGVLALALSTPAADPETGIAGYQYRVLNGAAVARDWPAGGVDITDAGTAFTLTSFTPVEGGVYTVELRAVNGHGQPGRVARSGPVHLDTSPPPTPSISASITTSGRVRRLNLTITAPADPQSGVYAHYLRVRATGSQRTTVTVADWHVVPTAAQGTYSYAITLPDTVTSGQQLLIDLSAVNRAALMTTAAGSATVPAEGTGGR